MEQRLFHVDPYAVEYFSSFLQGLGYKKIINKSDGEHSIVALKEKAAKEAGIESISKEAPRGDHQANGMIEAAVREIKAQVRVMKSSLEEKLQMKLGDKHPLLAWLPRHAADLISRYKVGQDGRTAEQRRTGRAWNRPLLQCGEKVMFKIAESPEERRRRGSLEPIMKEGWYIGHHARSGALLLITPNGVIRGNGVRRLPEDQRWDKENVTKLVGLPSQNSLSSSRGNPRVFYHLSKGKGMLHEPMLKSLVLQTHVQVVHVFCSVTLLKLHIMMFAEKG